MKKYILIILAIALMGTTQSFAQRGGGGGRPPKGERGGQMEEQSLTDEQKEAVLKILAKYDADTLTEEQALEIHEAFQELNVRGGRELAELLDEAGYDPRTLREMMPRPDLDGRQTDEV